jgi:hypothetical protein
MKVMSDDMTTQYFGTLSSPTGVDTWTFSGGTPISVRVKSSPDAFRIIVDFKSQAQLDAIAKILYPVTGRVTAFTNTTHPQAGSDTNSATITVDNQPPANAAWGTITVGDGQIILNWTNPADSDFAEVVILKQSCSPVPCSITISDAPTDGTTYTAGGNIGASTIVYVVSGTPGSAMSFTDDNVVNGTSYFYKIFSRDIYLNYASGVQTGPHTPAPVACNTIPNPLTADFTCTGDLTVSSTLTMSGDITLRVRAGGGGTGTLAVTGTGTIVVDPTNTFGRIVANNLEVQTGGVIKSDANSILTTGTGTSCGNGGGGGAGYGGKGGDASGNCDLPNGEGVGGNPYGSIDLGSGASILQGSEGNDGAGGPCGPPFDGSNGDCGGKGGGAIKIQVLGTLTNNGTVSANGGNGLGTSRGPGGGSGGSLYITTGTLAGTGLIEANGGNGDDEGGGGAGGRIRVDITPLNSYTGSYFAMGGAKGDNLTFIPEPGQAGTVFVLNDKTGDGLTPDDDLTVGGNGTLNGSLNINNLTVIQVGNSGNATRDRGTIVVAGDITAAASITVQSGGILATSGIHIITAPTMTVNSGGKIHADGLGCPSSQSYDYAAIPPVCAQKGSGGGAGTAPGFGEGGNNPGGSRGAGGAGYGGAGGDATGTNGGAGGFSYGDPDLTQVMLGSGGGGDPSSGILGGAGGGAVNINVSGTLTVDGTISASGSSGDSSGLITSGGGSGGSIFITVGTPAGTTGIIRTDGGDAPGNSGGGGGGRMRVEITGDNTFRGNCEALPGNAFLAGTGQAGSITFRARPDGTIDGFGLDQFGPLGTGSGGESTRTTQAGRTATYSLRLYNRDPFCSTETHTYHLFDTVPAGWSVEVVDNAGNKNTLPFDTGALHGATFADFTVRVTPSMTAVAGTYDLILNIQTNNLSTNFVDSVTIRVKVAGADGIIDGSGDNIYGAAGTGGGGQSSRNVTPNVTTSYGLTVQNDSGVSDSYSISWALPSGWTGLPGGGQVVVNDGTADQSSGFTTASIPGGGSALFTVGVTPPAAETLTQTIILDIVSTTLPADSVDSVKVIAAIASATAAPIACTGAGAPSAGCLAPAAISSSQIKVYWVDNSNNETGFRIERASGACSTFSVIFTLLRDTVGSPGTGQTLGYTDGGLAPSTAYCYRFQAFNSAGTATSLAITATTLAAAATHVPAAVTDLAVEPGNQTQNSILVSWTSPSDDNTVPGVGQTESYDLRYATSPIVDGGAGAGQIDFSAATAVSGVPAPKAAGSFETATVSGLTPNTIYYFALKSTNSIGASAMSNLAGGDNTTNGSAAGRTALRANLNLISVPLVPNPSDPDSVFQDDIGGVPQMWSWISSGLGMVEGVDGCYDQNPPDTASSPCGDLATLVPGKGYFIQGEGNRPVIDVPAPPTPVTPMAVNTGPDCTSLTNVYSIPLQVGWNIIGDPFPSNLTFSTVYVRQNGTTCLTFGAAVTNGWVGNSLYDYNGSGYDFLLYSSAILEPWKGYWMWVRNNDVFDTNTYELIVPTPP